MNAGYVPFFHVGVLVRDIERAAVDFGKLLGLRFEPVRSAPLVTGEPMRFRYSLPGPADGEPQPQPPGTAHRCISSLISACTPR